jgi:hypothetical protein
MESTVRLYSLTYSEIRTYTFAILFTAGNIILPQLCHLIPNGGLIFLPIYFFTLIAAYKYGIRIGLLVAILSPLANSLLFGMPHLASLSPILIKSVILAAAGAFAAHRSGKISLLAILAATLFYQLAGTAIEWAIVGDFFDAVQDIRIGIPGILFQVFGGYAALKSIERI